MKAANLYNEIISYCIVNSDESIVRKYARFFKDGVYNAFGLTQELLHDKVSSILSAKEIDFQLLRETSLLLVKGDKYEETSFAVLFYKSNAKEFDFEIFRDLTLWFESGIRNWAHCDVICSELLSVLLLKNIIELNSFKPWITAKSKYQRRAVPVALIKALKTSNDYRVLLKFVEPLMEDSEREVHQGMGWFLREAWKKQPETVETFLLKWKDSAPRLIFQYATEKMTPEAKLRFRRNK